MPRRTVNVSNGFDKAIRSFQARMIVENDRDVTYTEALNAVLCLGFMRPGPDGNIPGFWKPGSPNLSWDDMWDVMDGFDVDGFQFFDIMNMLPKMQEKSD